MGLKWPYRYTPRVLVLLLFVLALVMGFALGVMAGWQLILISRGETSVESSDNGECLTQAGGIIRFRETSQIDLSMSFRAAHYREVAKSRGVEFKNVYGKETLALPTLLLFFFSHSGTCNLEMGSPTKQE